MAVVLYLFFLNTKISHFYSEYLRACLYLCLRDSGESFRICVKPDDHKTLDVKLFRRMRLWGLRLLTVPHVWLMLPEKEDGRLCGRQGHVVYLKLHHHQSCTVLIKASGMRLIIHKSLLEF